MTIELIESVLGWSALINLGILLWWFLFITLAHDWIYRMHSRFYKIPVESFDTLHYAGMMIFKLANFMFFIVPYLALRIVE
jgi:hypothetical protein